MPCQVGIRASSPGQAATHNNPARRKENGDPLSQTAVLENPAGSWSPD